MSRTMPRPSEKDFYLAEFRGRSLALVLADEAAGESADLEGVLDDLTANRTGCVLISRDRSQIEKLAPIVPRPPGSASWPGEVWQAMAARGRVGLHIDEPPDAGSAYFAAACREVVLRLRLAKLIWIQQAGGVRSPGGQRVSLVDLTDLRDMLERPEDTDAAQRAVLSEVARLLEGGTSSVNLCDPEGLATELFTYAGSGTFFTRERYIEVRALGLDDFDAAADLIRRGTDEGFLLPRSPSEVEQVLGQAFGVFIEGRYLAGIGSLLPYPSEGVAEIASLYTVTRFAREGVGGHLVAYALQAALAAGMERVFACTVSDRVESFFVRQGFEPVSEDAIPEAKRAGHSSERRQQLRYLARSTAPESG